MCPKPEASLCANGGAKQGVARRDCSRHTETVISRESGHATQGRVGAGKGARFLLWNAKRQDSFADFCRDIVKIQAVPKPQYQAVVALGAFQVKRLEVDANKPGFPCGDCEIGSAGDNFNSGCIYSRHKRRDFDRVVTFNAFVVGAANKFGIIYNAGLAIAAAGGLEGVDDRMHGKR